ncbi:MAG: AAA family ATPase, partial [Cyanobacteria bacterium P01_D01_bin.56]
MSDVPDYPLPSIPGYTPTEQLYIGSRTIVYRAIALKGGQASNLSSQGTSVVIKALRSPQPTMDERAQMRNHFEIASQLSHPAIARPISLERYDGGYALIFPDEQLISLADYWQQTGQHTLSDALEIALQLTDALHYLSQQRVIHKDVKPTNILIHPATKQIKLTDFGIASLLAKEQTQLVNPNVLEGTLAYMSPAQTGRTNRRIDHRADYYSFGVTLYELLVGELPFPIVDPMALVHRHLASPVLFPEVSHHTIPVMVQAVIIKLMAKNAEDGYQSALGLKHDLAHCQQQWKSTGIIPNFDLGRRDSNNRFLVSEKLYGRNKELQSLLNAFERTAKGNSELILVTGSSGVGKTAIVNEIHQSVIQQKGYFIQGKFDQLNRSIPFSAFVQAFRSLVGQLLGEPDAQLENWKSTILTAVGESGQVLIEVIPELAYIIGTQPPIPELSGNAAQNRFNIVFQKFISVFTTPHHPLVIFLDDLQWVDFASLALLKLLLDKSVTTCLLLIGAYRDNELFPGHLLLNTLDEIKQLDIDITDLKLKPLAQSDISYLVADTLRCATNKVIAISQLVYATTQGNPFFTTQFLQELHHNNCITFDFETGYWHYDMSRIQQLPVSNNVVNFMVERLQKLPEATQNVLQLAACIGNHFDLDVLAIVCNQPQEDIASHLWKALQGGLVLPEDKTHKVFQGIADNQQLTNNINTSYRFLHDRVQQAAYALIPDVQKAQTHRNIGQLLLQNQSSEDKTKTIFFEIVGHLNAGIPALTNQSEQDRLAQLNLRACYRAKNATAYRAGYEYAKAGISLLDMSSMWQQQYETTLALHNALANLALLCGEFEVLGKTVVKITEHTTSILQQIPAYFALIQGKIFQNQRFKAIEISLSVLKSLGFSVPSIPTETDVAQQIERVVNLLKNRSIPELVELPVMSDQVAIAMIQIATVIVPSAYAVTPPLCPFLIALTVEYSIKYGNTGLSARAYGLYSFVACNILKNIKAGQQFGELALEMVERLDVQPLKSSITMVFGNFVVHRYSHARDTFPLLRAGYTSGLNVGDLENVGINSHFLCQIFLCSGKVLEEWVSEAQNYYDLLIRFHQPTTASYCKLALGVALSLQCLFPSRVLLTEDADQEADMLKVFQSESDSIGLGYFYIYKLWLCYLFGELDLAQIYASNTREVLLGVAGQMHESLFLCLDSLVVIARAKRQDDLTDTLKQVEANQQELKQHWASHAPMNYQHKVDLVDAERCRILGQRAQAIEYYDQAIAGAKENRFIQEEALANELAAKFYLGWHKERIAASYMQDAYACYAEWGATAKTDELVQKYPHLLQSVLQPSGLVIDPLETLARVASSQISAYSAHPSKGVIDSINQAFDFTAILKAAQTLTETLQVDELLINLSEIILQNSGGDHLILALPDSQANWQVRVVATPGSTDLCTTSVNTDTAPAKLIQYIKKTRELLYSDRLENTLPIDDAYLITQQPKSFLCAPLIHQNELFGVLYLHSSTTRSLISSNRIVTLDFLFSQVAIGLKNAKVFEESLGLKSQVIESSIDGMSILEDDKYIYVNKAYYELFGYDADDLLGEGWDKLHSPAELERLKEAVVPALIETGQWSGESIGIRKDGSSFFHELSVFSLDDGKVICVCRDISDRKRAEQQLQALSERLKLALDSGNIGVWEWDYQNQRLVWDDRMFAIFGVRPEDFNGTFQDWQKCVHPDDLAYAQAGAFPEHSSGKGSSLSSKEYRIIHPDGTVRHILATAMIQWTAQGELGRAIGVNWDISDRKIAEQALRDSQTRFQRMTENVPGMIYRYILHPDGHQELSYVSPQVREIYELEPEVVLQDLSRLQERIHPNDHEQIEAICGESARTLQPFKLEHRLILPKKGLRWIQAIARPELQDNGNIVWDGLALDISDRKQAEEKIRQTMAQLEASNNELESFSYSVSHDLRAPLRAINGFSQALIEDYSELFDNEAYQYFNRIRANANRMGQLIDDLLQLSQLSRSELRHCTVNMSTLAQEIFKDLQASEPERQVDIVVTPGLTVFADKALLQVVLMNLLQNAWKFTSHHSTARIEFGVVESQDTSNPVYFVKDD